MGAAFEGGELAAAGLTIAVLILGGVLIVLLLSPYVLFLLESLVLPALFVYRIVFRKPWTVQAVPHGAEREVRRWKVVAGGGGPRRDRALA